MPGKKTMLVRCSVAILLLATLAGACTVRDHYVRAKQLRTHADMQVITSRIEDLRSVSPVPPSDSQVQAIVDGVAQGRDAWGHRFIFRRNPAQEEFSYILVSYGSDGRLDVANLEDYFTISESRVQGNGRRDILFRDGLPVLNAGK